MKKLDLYYKMKEVWTVSQKEQAEHLVTVLTSGDPATMSTERLFEQLKIFVSKVHTKLEAACRNEKLFLKRNEAWLDGDFVFCLPQILPPPPKKAKLPGRPTKSFQEMSTRSKARRVKSLRSDCTSQELVEAAASSIHAEGKRNEAKYMRSAFGENNASFKETQQKAQQALENVVRPYTPDEALNLMVQLNLTKSKYNLLRSNAQAHNSNLYPSYSCVQNAKNECYPSDDAVYVSESCVGVQLQAILNLTAKRLMIVVRECVQTVSPHLLKKLKLICKWGSDGSSGYTMFKQVSLNPSLDDSSLYVTSFVPLQLYYIDENGRKVVVWQNPRPSSPRYCRPIRLEFKKETDAHIVEETNRVKEEISRLEPYEDLIEGREILLTYEMHMTMIDGKICNAVSGHRSTQSCYICGAKPSQMNNFNILNELHVKTELYALGLSSLHGWIRTFEYLLHVAYKLDIKKWQSKTDADKESVQGRKENIQREFQKQLGLNVDKPKQGFGNTNDGNTARSFFLNPVVSSEVTGIDQRLIERFQVILIALGSGYEIDVDKFAAYCRVTADVCIERYGWYPMPPTVHKILVHGASIIEAAPLPIGLMSEDAQECQHKVCKFIRTNLTRKNCRIDCNLDLLHWCLIASDLVITSLRKLPKKSSSGSLPSEVLDLLKEPDCAYVPDELEDEGSDDDSSLD